MVKYYSANDYYKDIFGEKVYKLALKGGTTCPTRDGTKGCRGCIFCSEADDITQFEGKNVCKKCLAKLKKI